MKGLLKNLGLIVMLAGIILLIVCQFTGVVNDNNILIGSCIAIIIGFVAYIVMNKKIA